MVYLRVKDSELRLNDEVFEKSDVIFVGKDTAKVLLDRGKVELLDRVATEAEEKAKPTPGDLVRMVNSNDSLIEDGNLGVIDGSLGKVNGIYSEEGGGKSFRVCFNPYKPHFNTKNGYVSTSGGPVYFIEPEDLEFTGEMKVKTFWRWENNFPGEGNGTDFVRPVFVWEYDGGGD